MKDDENNYNSYTNLRCFLCTHTHTAECIPHSMQRFTIRNLFKEERNRQMHSDTHIYNTTQFMHDILHSQCLVDLCIVY